MSMHATHPLDVAGTPRIPRTAATLPCPECGRTAEVVDRFTLPSTDGPVQHLRLRCPAGRNHLTVLAERTRST